MDDDDPSDHTGRAATVPARDPAGDLSRIIEMAWEDRTPFEAIERAYGLNESEVIRLMRHELKPASFRLWRRRVTGRSTKHAARRPASVERAHAPSQYKPRRRGR